MAASLRQSPPTLPAACAIDDPDALMPSSELRALCGGISPMTEWRWRRAGLLPAPLNVRGRNYYRRIDVKASLRALRGEVAA